MLTFTSVQGLKDLDMKNWKGRTEPFLVVRQYEKSANVVKTNQVPKTITNHKVLVAAF